MQSQGWACLPACPGCQDQGYCALTRGSPEGEITQLSLVPVGRVEGSKEHPETGCQVGDPWGRREVWSDCRAEQGGAEGVAAQPGCALSGS